MYIHRHTAYCIMHIIPTLQSSIQYDTYIQCMYTYDTAEIIAWYAAIAHVANERWKNRVETKMDRNNFYATLSNL